MRFGRPRVWSAAASCGRKRRRRSQPLGTRLLQCMSLLVQDCGRRPQRRFHARNSRRRQPAKEDKRYLGGPRVRAGSRSISRQSDRSTEPATGLGPFGLRSLRQERRQTLRPLPRRKQSGLEPLSRLHAALWQRTTISASLSGRYRIIRRAPARGLAYVGRGRTSRSHELPLLVLPRLCGVRASTSPFGFLRCCGRHHSAIVSHRVTPARRPGGTQSAS
jgi:hypothetical protein